MSANRFSNISGPSSSFTVLMCRLVVFVSSLIGYILTFYLDLYQQVIMSEQVRVESLAQGRSQSRGLLLDQQAVVGIKPLTCC